MAIPTFGSNAVDWEERIDLSRLREERLARLRAQLNASELGALLSFDFANIRYTKLARPYWPRVDDPFAPTR